MTRADAPDWFVQALAAPGKAHTVLADACPINYLTWGDAAKPPLVLVHGGLAHAMWWSALAPQLARDYYVIAPDLGGHGDSGHCPVYSHERWSDQVMAVCADAAGGRAPVLVGHSLGGQIAIVAAALHGASLAGIVIVDAPVTRPAPESGAADAPRPLTVYPTLEAAMARFRLLPDQPCENRYLFEHVARHSLRENAGGWSWKFDPRVLTRQLPAALDDYLVRAACRVTMMRGEFSVVVPPEIGEEMVELLDRSAPLIDIPASWHHLIIDQPLAFIAALRAVLAVWEHSIPRAAGATR